MTYDRRGFSRSRDARVPDRDDARFARDLADIDELLDHVGAESASLFGSSSGAILTLHYLATRPDRVQRAVVHEPPLVPLLPDGAEWLARLDDVYAVYRESGVTAGMAAFGKLAGTGSGQAPDPDTELPPAHRELITRMQANLPFFLDREMRVYPRRVPDLDTLDELRDRIVLAGGAQSHESFPYFPNTVLAKRFGTDIVDFPGDHAGYGPHFPAFAAQLRAVLNP